MFDYYRARFKFLVPPRRPISRTTLGPPAMSMPVPLQRLCWLSWFLAGIAVATALHTGFPSRGVVLAWIEGQILLFPVSVTLGAGFSERQGWARLLLIGLLGLAVLLLALAGLWVLATAAFVVTAGVGFYLYTSAASRTYYAHLREEAMVRISLADLRSLIFVPLYTAGVGVVSGVVLGWWLVSRYLAEHPHPGHMGPNDAYAIVLASVACAAAIGVLGRLLGDALVSRLNRTRSLGG